MVKPERYEPFDASAGVYVQWTRPPGRPADESMLARDRHWDNTIRPLQATLPAET